jgi:hypothetical protein
LFERALPRASELTSPRAMAYALLGIEAYLGRFSGATEVRRAQSLLAERLHGLFVKYSKPEWPWPEEILAYANGLLPHALIAAGSRLGNKAMIDTALASLSWLVSLQTDPKGHFVPIGNRGWYTRGGSKARFDQQPIEVQHMAAAELEAYRVTADRQWLDEARRCFEWFLGRNDLRQPVVDHATGGCRDGLQAEGINQNQGAESTLAWLHSLIALHIAMGTAEITVHDISAARSKTPIAPLAVVKAPPKAAITIPERAASAPNL